MNNNSTTRVVILGGGVSGFGSAILARKMGFDTFLSDKGKVAPKYRRLLEEWDVNYEDGGHTEELILSATEVIKSPGIPDKAPLIQKLRAKGTPIISEIEFAARYMGAAHTICITGSNGKTTTTSLIYKILERAGYNVALGGNIGQSFAYSVATAKYDWYVLELSSFQLDGMYEFKADISILMNITPDHLDRYDYDFQKYVDSKMRIVQNQTITENFIFSLDDHSIVAELKKIEPTMSLLPFAAVGELRPRQGAYLDGDTIYAHLQDHTVTIPTCEMQIQGLHNTYNAMAASLAALSAGVTPEIIEHSIKEFSPVEHRLEPAGVIDGVAYINDSKATNVDSAWYALESLRSPAVWIAGGTDKGNNYEPLKELAAGKVHTLICMGVDNEALKAAFKGVIPHIVSTHTFEDAMSAAYGSAISGDVVLLSPACASFDLFKNYEHRGQEFKAWVAERMCN